MEGMLAADASNHSFLRYSWDADDRAAAERLFDNVLDMNPWFTSVVHGRDRGLEAVGYVRGSCPTRRESRGALCEPPDPSPGAGSSPTCRAAVKGAWSGRAIGPHR